jgi:hypothetical protein
MTNKQKEKEILKAKLELAKLMQKREEYKSTHEMFYFKPYAWQDRFIDLILSKNISLACASNKIGKTAVGVNIIGSWLLGYEPWNKVDKDYPGAVLVNDNYYKPSSLGIKPPVELIVCGEDWKMHLGKTIVPELKKWLPVGEYTTKKNELGIEYLWKIKNKSVLTLMCYTQDDALFESFRAQGVWLDEPPPESKFHAMSRGLLLDCGKFLFTMTPLKEPWILDEFILSGRKDVGVADNLIITANEDLKKKEDDVLMSLGLNEAEIETYYQLLLYSDFAKKKPVKDRGKAAESFVVGIAGEARWDEIGTLPILTFIKNVKPSEVPSRVFGEFKSLIGRIIKEYEQSLHVISNFNIKLNWPVVVMIDKHLNKEQAVSFYTVDERGIHFAIKEIWLEMSPDEVAEAIIKTKVENKWDIKKAYIDPLSKGDNMYMKDRFDVEDSFTIIKRKLSRHGILLNVATKDKDSGIDNIRDWFAPRSGVPCLYFFESCVRHQHEILRWVYDDDGKPSKDVDDHFMENLYRYTLTGNRFVSHEESELPEYALEDRYI